MERLRYWFCHSFQVGFSVQSYIVIDLYRARMLDLFIHCSYSSVTNRKFQSPYEFRL